MECQDAAINFHKDLKLYYLKRIYDLLNLDTPRELVKTQLPLSGTRDAGSGVKVDLTICISNNLYVILVHTKV